MDAATKERLSVVPIICNEFVTPAGIRFSSACFQGPGNEWSLSPFQEPQDVSRNSLLARSLSGAMRHLEGDRAYAPSPAQFNGCIIQPSELSKVFVLEPGILMLRNSTVPADGTLLRRSGDVGIFSASGCGVIVAALGTHLLFAHAGRDCVINRKRVLGEPGARQFESVVDSIVDTLIELRGHKSAINDIHAWMFYSIKPEDFVHRYDNTTHGVYNRLVGTDLIRRGLGGVRRTEVGVEIDVPVVVKEQFIQRGVPAGNISLTHGYLADELPHTRKEGGGRYLVAVARH